MSVFQLKELPKNVRILTLCLRSLYVEKAVDTSAYNATGINNIRDQTRQDGIVYVKGILHMSTQVVRCVYELFENCESRTLDEWQECLPGILKDVAGYQQCCTEIVRMHEEMMVPLKQRQDEAKSLICELRDINKELQEKKTQLEEEAANSESWASGLRFVPIVGLVVVPILRMSARGDITKAVEGGSQVNINEAAIVIVTDVLIPAISAFIHGLCDVAGFFAELKDALNFIQSNGNQAFEGHKQIHYMMMESKAVEVNRSCREFYAMIPEVRTDLQCIPEKPIDQNYLKKWLTKQQEVLTWKYNKMLTETLEELLKQCE